MSRVSKKELATSPVLELGISSSEAGGLDPSPPRLQQQEPPLSKKDERPVGGGQPVDPGQQPVAIRAEKRTPAQRKVIKALGEGEAFDVKTAAAIEAIAGVPISKAGLTALYGRCFPDRPVRISLAVEKDWVAYTVSYSDNLGGTVATLRRKLRRSADGSLELYGHSRWVEPELRGLGFSARVWREEQALLGALSSHPKTRITLWAGGMNNPKASGDFQTIGAYVWARFGFDFAEQKLPRSMLASNVDKARCSGDEGESKKDSDLVLMRRQFGSWLMAQAEAGQLPKDTAAKLAGLAGRWSHPWEVAQFKVEGLAISGRDFLLSKFAPRWEGVFWVNHKRTKAHHIAAGYAAHQLETGAKTQAAFDRALSSDLASADPEVVKAALLRAGKLANATWIPSIEALAAAQPELTEDAATAVLKIQGKWTPPRPPIVYSGAGERSARVDLPADLQHLEIASVEELVTNIVEGERRIAMASLDVLAVRSAEVGHALIAEAAVHLFDHYPGEDDWQVRRSAINHLMRLPEDVMIEDLARFALKEDDINVLISIQRVLEQAESPKVEAATAALGIKIEAMKREIEEALRSL